MGRSTIGRIGPALVYVLALAVVGLGGTELAVRMLDIAPGLPNQYAMYVRDPVLPHRPRPGSVLEGRAITDEFDFHYAHNSRGYRDVEHELAKPSGTFRILGLGDSFTYGAAVDFDDTYLARLERLLNERPGDHPRVEVIKAGIPRFFPESERLLLEHEGLGYAPDLVVVGFVPNDVLDTHLGMDGIEVTSDGRLVSNYGARLIERLGPLTLFLYERVHSARILLRAYLQKTAVDRNPFFPLDVYRADGRHEGDWEEVERQYDAMAEAVGKRGAELVILHLPAQGPWNGAHGYPAQRLGAWAERAGVVFVDTLPALRRHPDWDALHWSLDGHPTAEGHALFAQTLLDALTRRGLVP